MFITFEGGEGSGKTTQAKRLVENLQKKGIKALFTREPGGTELAEKIRALLLGDQGIENALTEFLLITAARHDHVESLIKPKLAQGFVVVCDRFFDSSIVYQGLCKALDISLMQSLHYSIFQGFEPDVTFLIDIDPEIAQRRITLPSSKRDSNHYDQRDITFHKKVRQGLLECAKLNPKRFLIIDGTLDMKTIENKLLEHVLLSIKP
ncbi:MAG: tmk [Candidatus Midichloriaceae bacterium]|jgi:dTMP kinase|nr:tmk [Candidatus Midichloriaceae bacterium]